MPRIASDAIGFIAGALLGYWLARLLGLDLLRDPWGDASVLAVAAVGLGGGMGLAAAQRWRVRTGRAPRED